MNVRERVGGLLALDEDDGGVFGPAGNVLRSVEREIRDGPATEPLAPVRAAEDDFLGAVRCLYARVVGLNLAVLILDWMGGRARSLRRSVRRLFRGVAVKVKVSHAEPDGGDYGGLLTSGVALEEDASVLSGADAEAMVPVVVGRAERRVGARMPVLLYTLEAPENV